MINVEHSIFAQQKLLASLRIPFSKGLRISIVGFGNPYMGDDAVGIKILEGLKNIGLPDNVEIHECSSEFDLINIVDKADALIIVDSMLSGVEPGTVVVEELRADMGEVKPITSLHGLDITSVLPLVKAINGKPSKVIFVGIEAEDISVKEGLSPKVESAIPEAIKTILNLIGV